MQLMTNAAERSIRRSDLENWSRQILWLARTSAPSARTKASGTKTHSKDKCVRSKSITTSSLSAACWGRERKTRGRCLFLALKVLTTRFQSQLLRLLTRRQNRIFHRPEDSCTERGVTPDFRLKTGRIRHACHGDCDAESPKEQLRARANSPPKKASLSSPSRA
jgi:hypothetical protein